jgi:hypothetical protein
MFIEMQKKSNKNANRNKKKVSNILSSNVFECSRNVNEGNLKFVGDFENFIIVVFKKFE